jgi:ribosome maturation factor RimP
LVRSAGVELLDVEMLSENRMTVLRATIYRPEGITLDDCARTQHILSDRLDEIDPIQGSYSLEVSSPGIERVLRRPKEFAIYRGEPCQVNLFAPQDGKRVFEGRLVELAVEPDGSETVVIEVDDRAGRPGKSAGRKLAGGKFAGDAGGKSADGKSAGGKPKRKPSGGGSTGNESIAAKNEPVEGDQTGGPKLVSFDRKNVSRVKLLYKEEEHKKGRN